MIRPFGVIYRIGNYEDRDDDNVPARKRLRRKREEITEQTFMINEHKFLHQSFVDK